MQDTDYSPEHNIKAWDTESLNAREWRKRGWEVTLPPVCLNDPNVDYKPFQEDCDFIVRKGTKLWLVMHKAHEFLNDLDHDSDDLLEAYNNLSLDEWRANKFDHADGRLLPVDKTWKAKFHQHCPSLDERAIWYSKRIWSISDPESRTTFLFRGADIEKDQEKPKYKETYIKGTLWNFYPASLAFEIWSKNYTPYLERPWSY